MRYIEPEGLTSHNLLLKLTGIFILTVLGMFLSWYGINDYKNLNNGNKEQTVRK